MAATVGGVLAGEEDEGLTEEQRRRRWQLRSLASIWFFASACIDGHCVRGAVDAHVVRWLGGGAARVFLQPCYKPSDAGIESQATVRSTSHGSVLTGDSHGSEKKSPRASFVDQTT